MPEERERKRRKSSSGGDRAGGGPNERGGEKSGNGRHAAEKPAAEPQDLKSGELLRRARLERRLEVEEVSAAIHVRPAQLRALEEGHLESLPGMPYALGFLKSYAQFLKLDAGTIINKFKAEHNMAPPKAALKFPEPISERKMPDPVMLGVAAAAVVVCAIAWTMYSGSEEKMAVATSAIPPPPDIAALTTQPSEATPGAPAAPAANSANGNTANGNPANPATAAVETNPALSTPPPVDQAPAAPTVADRAAAEATGTPLPAPGAAPGSKSEARPASKSAVLWDAPLPRQRPKAAAQIATQAATQAAAAPMVLKPGQKSDLAAAAPQAAAPGSGQQDEADDATDDREDAPKTDASAAPAASANARNNIVANARNNIVANARNNNVANARNNSVATARNNAAVSGTTAEAEDETDNEDDKERQGGPAAASADARDSGAVIKVHRGKSRVMLQARQDSWVQITDQSHRVVFKQVLHPGEKYFVPDEPGMSLITSNAGGFDVFVDGSQVQPIGRAGDIVRGVTLDPSTLSVQRIRVRTHEED